jgi:iron(III) transport system ATP-binding protein
MSTPVKLRAIRKQFGQTVAVNHVDLDIPAGALFFLLGPSGCGKTTLLRMLAGFTEPTAGTIHFGDQNVTHLSANKRECGMVFQSYALWPHMTVEANVAFGLTIRKVSAADRKRRVDAALASVHMSPYAQRKPNELSGGQQQRVALARAIVIEPKLLLLDEPLSNLDAKLRLEMRSQIRRICKQTGITAVYVTHDQKEALSMADAMAVLRDGDVEQVGAPREVYDRPNNRFVADFLGETNFIPAEVMGRDGDAVILDSPAGPLRSTAFPDDLPNKGSVTCSIRPEAVRLLHGGESADGNTFELKHVDTVYLGEMAQHQFTAGDQLPFKAFELNPGPLELHDGTVRVSFAPKDVVILSD